MSDIRTVNNIVEDLLNLVLDQEWEIRCLTCSSLKIEGHKSNCSRFLLIKEAQVFLKAEEEKQIQWDKDVEKVKEAAKFLANEHNNEHKDWVTKHIFWMPNDKKVLLVEILRTLVDSMEILPFHYSANPPDSPFEVTLILLSEGDWERVKSGELKLPSEWEISKLVML